MTMNLYSVQHFRSIGSTTQSDIARLTADDGRIVSVGNLKWTENRKQFEALQEGLSTVVALQMDGMIVSEGWRVTRLPDYRQGRMVYDKHAKEIVMLTNGKCVLDHSTTGYAESHGYMSPSSQQGTCHYAPSEAIALRAFIDNSKAVIAWTYRAVNPCDLEPINYETKAKSDFDAVMVHRRSSRFIGRI